MPNGDSQTSEQAGFLKQTEGPATATYARPAQFVGALIAGRYSLERRLGEGGMGEVWVARQNEPVKRRVALKLIKAGMDSKAVLARFEQERQALALMDHPHIARVYDAGLSADQRPYFVMEFVDGLTLIKYSDEVKLTTRQRLELFLPICQAVQHAHHKGIIHRDLKPGNILVTMVDGKPVPKVIDFGVAKATGGKLTEDTLSTQIGAIVGTLEYMAPEQAGHTSHDVDTRADLYSLGVILYELLTGLRPFDPGRMKKAAFDELIRIIREEEPPSLVSRLTTYSSLPNIAAVRQTEPRKLVALMKGELDWIVRRCLEKDRNRRYETANGLARDVERYLRDEPVEARPVSAGYRLRKYARKHRALLATTVTIVSLLVAGIAATTWGLIRANHAAEAEKQTKIAEASERRASAATEDAMRRLSQVEKAIELFAGMLTGIKPQAEEQGEDSLAEQLRRKAEKAATELDGESIGDPLAVARLQTIFGEMLRGLRSHQVAVTVLEKARLTRESKLGNDHPDTLITMYHLAGTYQEVGRLQEAIKLFEHVRDVRLAKLGADHSDTLTTLDSIAVAYHAAGRHTEAISLFEQVRDARVRLQGSNNPLTLITLSNMAIAYESTGAYSQAIKLFEQVRDAREKQLGSDHQETLSTMTKLALAYQAADMQTEAIKLFEQIHTTCKLKFGANQPYTLNIRKYLVSAYNAAGRASEVKLLEDLPTSPDDSRGRASTRSAPRPPR